MVEPATTSLAPVAQPLNAVVTAATAATTIDVRLNFIIFTPNVGFGFFEAMLKPYS
jgi:hypothetical protein